VELDFDASNAHVRVEAKLNAIASRQRAELPALSGPPITLERVGDVYSAVAGAAVCDSGRARLMDGAPSLAVGKPNHACNRLPGCLGVTKLLYTHPTRFFSSLGSG
jgi:hypothetical protein